MRIKEIIGDKKIKDLNFIHIKRGKFIFHIPEGMNIKCNKCGNCCRTTYVGLSMYEINRIKKYLRKKKFKRYKEFLMRKNIIFTDENGITGTSITGYYLKKIKTKTMEISSKIFNDKCIFLTKHNKCLIHEIKPLKCKEYPFNFLYQSLKTAIEEGIFKIGMVIDISCNGFSKERLNYNIINNLVSVFEKNVLILMNQSI